MLAARWVAFGRARVVQFAGFARRRVESGRVTAAGKTVAGGDNTSCRAFTASTFPALAQSDTEGFNICSESSDGEGGLWAPSLASAERHNFPKESGVTADAFGLFRDHALKLVANRPHSQGELLDKLVGFCFRRRRRLLKRWGDRSKGMVVCTAMSTTHGLTYTYWMQRRRIWTALSYPRPLLTH